ncbi:MAG: DivIVA domain-containing protein [Ruminococcaceae bacterium]|nr:DivIVA domain-containing protein [Oscillospiraceae bacterium]
MLTPVDIENKEFAKAFRGYDSIEVDEFMRSLVADYEKLYRDNGSLKEKNALLSETLENYKGMETTMQNAILVAQKTSEDIKQNAYERSNTIIKEAEIKAENIITEAEKRVSELEKEYSTLKKEMNTFRARMNSLLNTYLKLLDDMPESESFKSSGTEIVSDLEKDIDKIKKHNSERADLQNLTLNKQSVYDVMPDAKSFDAEKEEPKASALENAQQASSSDTEYTPKKVNPLVDELLKKRANSLDTSDETDSEPSDDINEESVPEEIIIDLSKNNNKPYDVFSDESL